MLSTEERLKIYRYLDKNGIPWQFKAGFEMGFARKIGGGVRSRWSTFRAFIPSLPFKISDDDQIQVILDYVYDLSGTQVNNIEELEELSSIDGKPFMLLLNEHNRDNLRLTFAFKTIPGSLIIRGHQQITTLGNVEEIKGDLGFSDSEIQDLGKLKEVKGDFWIAQSGVTHFTNLNNLFPLEQVHGNMSLKNSPVKNLATLRCVAGNLSLRYTHVDSLGKLEQVKGNLLISKKLADLDFSQVAIGGKLKMFNDRYI